MDPRQLAELLGTYIDARTAAEVAKDAAAAAQTRASEADRALRAALHPIVGNVDPKKEPSRIVMLRGMLHVIDYAKKEIRSQTPENLDVFKADK